MAGFPVGIGGYPVGRLGRSAVDQHVRDLSVRNSLAEPAGGAAVVVSLVRGGSGAEGVGEGVRRGGAEPSAVASLLRRAGSGANGAAARARAAGEGVLPHQRASRLGSATDRLELSAVQRRGQRAGAACEAAGGDGAADSAASVRSAGATGD